MQIHTKRVRKRRLLETAHIALLSISLTQLFCASHCIVLVFLSFVSHFSPHTTFFLLAFRFFQCGFFAATFVAEGGKNIKCIYIVVFILSCFSLFIQYIHVPSHSISSFKLGKKRAIHTREKAKKLLIHSGARYMHHSFLSLCTQKSP